MEKPKLSICVLSYNQMVEIERLLLSLEPQMTPDIEIIIRDDSTDNETERLVAEFSKRIPIRYFHGKKEGIDRTVIFLTKEAEGDFVWWIGNDTIYPGGISKVLSIIKNNLNVDFIWANYNIAGGTDLMINLPSDRLFSSVDEILSTGSINLGFISATIFRREKALSGIAGAEKYVGSLFSNLFIIFHVLSGGGSGYFLRGPIVQCYPTMPEKIKEQIAQDGKIENRGFEVFGITFRNILKEFSGRFKRKTIRKILKKTFANLWRGVLVRWITGLDTLRGKRWPMFKYYWSFPEFWIALPLFLIPRPILGVLYRTYKFVRE